MFSEKAKLSSLWSSRLEKVFSKILYFPGNENRRKFGACFKRYAPKKVGFFSPPFLLPPMFSYVDISPGSLNNGRSILIRRRKVDLKIRPRR